MGTYIIANHSSRVFRIFTFKASGSRDLYNSFSSPEGLSEYKVTSGIGEQSLGVGIMLIRANWYGTKTISTYSGSSDPLPLNSENSEGNPRTVDFRVLGNTLSPGLVSVTQLTEYGITALEALPVDGEVSYKYASNYKH